MNTNLALGFLYSGDIWDEDTPYELHDVGYEMLAELKGKDLVEVVRCKDCKYYETEGNYCNRDIVKSLLSTQPTDFCSWAERRESE